MVMAWSVAGNPVAPAIQCNQLWERISGWEVVLVAVVIALCFVTARVAQMYFTWRIASNQVCQHCSSCETKRDE